MRKILYYIYSHLAIIRVMVGKWLERRREINYRLSLNEEGVYPVVWEYICDTFPGDSIAELEKRESVLELARGYEMIIEEDFSYRRKKEDAKILALRVRDRILDAGMSLETIYEGGKNIYHEIEIRTFGTYGRAKRFYYFIEALLDSPTLWNSSWRTQDHHL